MELVDQINRTIYFKDAPKRIISLVPSQTELLCDLGLEPYLVGVTKFCVNPHHIKTKVAVVGGTKQIQIEKIKALKPDIILCNKEENTKAIVEACQLICTVHVSDIFNVEDSVALIKQYGSIFNKKQEALLISNTIESEMESFNVFILNKPVLKIVYFIWKNPWMVAANNTFIDYLLKLNHFENVFASKMRYPEIDILDPASNENVDLVLLSSEPFPFKETHKKELQENYPNAKVVLVDGEMFSWYGSRLTKAFTYFKSLRLSLQNTAL
ncbi:helical backbone metal receptor [Algibacter sp. AS12]|uniref:ABC transporter substrate-binding protein n=1 Tax=Algibacter sp. AS12 TaxID=3135773 RepID=UPI00398B1F1F